MKNVKNQNPPSQNPLSDETFLAARGRRNIAIFSSVIIVCVVFFLITIIQLGGFS